ncbi:MAG: prenyltransferase/squalene oxidase repeat-containing protein [Polyangiaceae bacterium]
MPTFPRFDRARATLARERAVKYLLTHRVEAPNQEGFLFHSPMEGRVLDTALTLHLLQKHGLDFVWQERLRDFLVSHVTNADVLSTTVAQAVLLISRGGKTRRDDPVFSAGQGRLLQGLKHARRRKKALIGTLLAEVSAISYESVTFDPQNFLDEVTHLFSEIYFAALKIIHGRRRGASESSLGNDIAFLERMQAEGGSWEQQSLLTIVALLALGPASPSFEPGLSFLRRMTRENGGVAFCDNLNLWTTGLAGLALVEREDIDRADLLAVTEYIVSQQQPSGGWAFSEGVIQTDTDTSAQCAQLLLQVDKERYAEQIDAAHAHFAERQRPDGGYPTYEVAGESEATMTANIALIQAMSIEAHPEFQERIERALAFLCAHQSPDGTFERSWSLSEVYSIFRVSWAFNVCSRLVTGPELDEARRRSATYLLATQRPDGGWGHTATSPSDALSTSYALLSLKLLDMPVHRAHFTRGLNYLLSQQDPETGEVVSIPDVVGPRPIVFNIPLLSTVFAVMALRALET